MGYDEAISDQLEANWKINQKASGSQGWGWGVFYNRTGIVLEDTRAEHQTEPPTVWFIAPTHQNRLLKIVYVLNDGVVYLKTAFEPNPQEKLLYLRMALGDHL